MTCIEGRLNFGIEIQPFAHRYGIPVVFPQVQPVVFTGFFYWDCGFSVAPLKKIYGILRISNARFLCKLKMH
jgi:hypothetical protein